MLYFSIESGIAQNLPKELESFVSINNENGSLKTIDKLSERQANFFWKDTRVNIGGYLEIDTSPMYLKCIDNFLGLVDKKITSPIVDKILTNLLIKDLSYEGALIEKEGKINYLFLKNGQGALLISIWNYKAAGAKVTLPTEFFNQEVRGVKSILSLSTSASENIGIWKMSWWTKSLSYEVYVLDKVIDNKSQFFSPSDIVEIATYSMDKE